MRSIEDKGCLNYCPTEGISGVATNNFEFQRGKEAIRNHNHHHHHHHHHRTALGKPTPSKWDDAQKWLVNLSRGGGEKRQSETKPRNSNADDRRLIGNVPKEESYSSDDEDERGGVEKGMESECIGSMGGVETKNVDCEESIWRINKGMQSSSANVRSICVRDMGTEMTPIASQEPSRTGTPIRARTPAARSPTNSRSSTPVRGQQRALQAIEGSPACLSLVESRGEASRGNVATSRFGRDGEDFGANRDAKNKNSEQAKDTNPLETRATAWDEAERAKYMARFKREEVKIQAWENREKRKAEMEMKRMEVKADRLKSRAQERLTNKISATRRIAEEKRANAEAKLNEKGVRTTERADYIRRTGHMPSSFSFKLPSLCW